MADSKYTPGKLTFRHSSDGKRYSISGSADSYFVNLECAVDSDDRDHDVALANTKRLVACWNALDGIPTEVIETGIVRFTADLGPIRGVCSWCGLELYGDSDPKARMRQHQRECPKHPMAALLGPCEQLAAVFREGLFATIKPDSDLAGEIMAAVVKAKEEQNNG